MSLELIPKSSTEKMAINYDDVKKWLESHVHRTFKSGCDEFNVMNEILQQHPNYNDWKNKDVEAFKVTRSKKVKALQTHIKMKGGKWRIVSWVACAKGKVTRQPNDSNQLTQAMRYSVRVQIKKWRNTIGVSYNPKCNICHCDDKMKLEVDHYPLTFAKIRDEFLKKHEDECQNLTFRWDNKNTSFRFQKNEALNIKWQRYHLKHASYRWLCGDCNKKMNRKKTI